MNDKLFSKWNDVLNTPVKSNSNTFFNTYTKKNSKKHELTLGDIDEMCDITGECCGMDFYS